MRTNGNTLTYLYDENGTMYGFELNGVRYYYLYNGQGDVIGLIDATGAVIAHYEYDAWGKLLSVTDANGEEILYGTEVAIINPIRYRGYYYDNETGFYYLNSRYYDPEVGRWINADSVISGASGSIQGYNMFTYCFNNPVNMEDRTGSWPSWSDIKETAINIGKSIENTFNDVKDWVVDNSAKIGKTVLTTFQGLTGEVAFGGGLGGSLEMSSVVEATAVVKADIQQITVNGFDGFDFGKEMKAEAGIGIGPWSASAISGDYHSDLCSYYEQGDHDRLTCPNTIVYDPSKLDTGISIGIDAYVILGVTLEIGYDYKRVYQTWIDIWEE